MFSEGFWVIASFICFIGLVFKPVKKAALAMLDAKAAKIIQSLEESATIKADALKMLEEVKAQYNNVKADSKAILDKAKLEAKVIIDSAKAEADRITKKRTELALQRISQEEENIIRNIKSDAVEAAINSVQQHILDEVDKNAKLGLIEESIKSLKKFMH